MAHALLSPSSAAQWMACTVSPRLSEGFPNSSSGFADEGTLAHAYAETYLRYFDDKLALRQALEELKNHEHAKHYNEELEQHAEDFADYVLEQCTGQHWLEIEQKLDLRDFVPEGFGTGDAIVVKDGVLNLNDLKYGKGVSVSSVENRQLMIYGLGCIKKYSWMYDFDTIRIHIYQPRLQNISVWSISVEELLKWGEEELKPKAEKAFRGEGEAVPGEHCRFCKVKAQCRAFSELATQYASEEYADPALLSIEEIAGILPKIKIVEMYTKAIQDYAYARLLSGDKVPGYKMVKGKPSRYYLDEAAIKAKLLESGFTEDDIMAEVKPRPMKTLSVLEKKVKKSKFTELVGIYLGVKNSSPSMAPEDDPREEYSAVEDDFADLMDGDNDKE